MSKGSYPADGAGFKGTPGGTGELGAIQTAPRLRGRRKAVLEGVEQKPGSAEQIGERIGLHWYLTRPRLSELKALGLVVETGERGKGALGGKVNVWRATTAEERGLFNARKALEAEKSGVDQ
jgi:predicted ArsR family transcriptional regulator